jgi:N-acetylmuramoyl-L-alanine amidase
MAESTKLKRRLLREAVEENISAVNAIQERRRRWKRQRFRLWATRGTLLASIPLLVAGTFQLVGAGSPAPPPLSLRATAFQAVRLEDGTVRRVPVRRLTELRRAEPAAPSISPATTFDAPAPLDRAVLPLSIRHIVIDPGHGGTSPGTSGHDLIEKEVTLDLGLRLRKLLVGGGFAVTVTRDSDASISLQERAELANGAKGDVFVSIHLNWIESRESRGVETYYLGPTDDPALRRLAAIENKDSGYSLTDYKSLIERIYLGVRQNESRRFAETVQGSLFAELRKTNSRLDNRGVKTAPFIVLVATEMPAILAEVSCLSNEQEVRNLRDSNYRQRIAEALYRGIRNFAADHEDGKGG